MDFDYKKLADFLIQRKMINKSFKDLTKLEIKWLCEAVHEFTSSHAGFEPPYLTDSGSLVIPYNAPLKYRYWQHGQSPRETLIEMGASQEIIERYTPTGFRDGLPKSED